MKGFQLIKVALSAMAVFSGVQAADLDFSFTTIDFPGASVTRASGINSHGEIVGSFDDAASITHGFLFSRGAFTTIDDPSASCTFPPCGTSPFAINSRGEIVGNFQQVQGSSVAQHGFLFSDGRFTTIDFPGAAQTGANGINDQGQIIGGFAFTPFNGGSFLDTRGVFIRIDVPGAQFTGAVGINDRGQIVGNFINATGTHGFLDTDGTFITIDVPGAIGTFLTGINSSGQIVGQYFDTAQNLHSFLLSGGRFTTIDIPGSSVTEAHGINNRGQIVGTYANTTGVHGFLATP